MVVALEEPPKYVSDAMSLKDMLSALDEHRLVDTDPADRWCIEPELAPLIRQILEPSALAQRCLSLAGDVRSWVSGQAGLIDTNAFEDRFRERLTAVREKVARDYAITDPALTGMPSGAERVRAIADALMRMRGSCRPIALGDGAALAPRMVSRAHHDSCRKPADSCSGRRRRTGPND